MFRGEYKLKNVNGKPITYTRGDVVSYQGKVYECKIQTEKSPLQASKKWYFVGLTENTVSEQPPINPAEGQIWTSTNGISYVWFNDGNSFQWVET
jgi:hypothetical protein